MSDQKVLSTLRKTLTLKTKLYIITSMTKELELKLVEKYPKILKDYEGNEMETCMHWGFEHNDGWYDLLDKGMEKIQRYCDLAGCQLIADQIKEKFGDLRFYYHTDQAGAVDSEILSDIVDSMERKSSKICENTGELGCLCKRGGWYKTLSYTEGKKYGYTPVSKTDQEYWKYLDSKMVEVPTANE